MSLLQSIAGRAGYGTSYDEATRRYNNYTSIPGYKAKPGKIPKVKLDDPIRRQIIDENIGSKALGALGAVGSVFDLGGSVVRDTAGLMTGMPVNPVNQLLPWNWTDPTKRISGSDLNRHIDKLLGTRAISKKNNWRNISGGIATEILLDPLTYVSFGGTAATKLGKVAEKIGLMKPEIIKTAAKTAGVGEREFLRAGKIDDLMKAAVKTGGIGGLGAPVNGEMLKRMDDVIKGMGYADRAAFIQAHGGEGLRAGLRYGLPGKLPHTLLLGNTPAGRGLARRLDTAGKWIMDKPFIRDVNNAFSAQMMRAKTGLGRAFAPIGFHSGVSQVERNRKLVMEGIQQLREVSLREAKAAGTSTSGEYLTRKAARDLRRALVAGEHADPVVDRVVKRFLGHTRRVLDDARALSRKLTEFDDISGSEFFPRQLTNELGMDLDITDTLPPELKNFLELSPSTVHEKGRIPMLSSIKGAGATIDDVVTDRKIKTIIENARANKQSLQSPQVLHDIQDVIRRDYGGEITDVYRQSRITGAKLRDLMHDNPELVDLVEQYKQPNLSEAAKLAISHEAARKFQVMMPKNAAKAGFEEGQYLWKTAADRRMKLAKWITGLTDQAREVGVFGNHPAYDLLRYLDRETMANIHATTIYDMLGEGIARTTVAGAAHTPKGPTYLKLMEDVGLDGEKAVRTLAERTVAAGKSGGMDADKLAKQLMHSKVPLDLASDIERIKPIVRTAADKPSPLQFTDSLQAIFKANVTSPFPAFHFRNLMSGQLQNWFAGQFSISSVRDADNLVRKGSFKDASKIPAIKELWEERKKLYPELYRNEKLTDESASRLFMETSYATESTGSYGGGAIATASHTPGRQATMSAVDETSGQLPDMMAYLPGNTRFSRRSAAKAYVGRRADTKLRTSLLPMRTITAPFYPLELAWWKARKAMGSAKPRPKFFNMPEYAKVAGTIDKATGKMRTASVWGPHVGGLEASHYVESLNRLAPMIKLMREGMDWSAAASKAAEAQFRYQGKFYTAFERNWMRRIFPFYTFQRSALPFALKHQLARPGGAMTQMQRIAKGLRDPGKPVPEYIADTPAIEIPKSMKMFANQSPGWASYLSGFSTMQEDPWQIMGAAANMDPAQLGYEFLGRTTPLLKGGIELPTGVSLYQRGVDTGRPIDKLDPILGRIWTSAGQKWSKYVSGENFSADRRKALALPGKADFIAANSPISRYLSTIRTLLHPTKSYGAMASNLLSGIRITDFSPSARSALIQQRLAKELRKLGGSDFVKTSMRYEDWKRLSPADKTSAVLIKAMLDEIAANKRLASKQEKMSAGLKR